MATEQKRLNIYEVRGQKWDTGTMLQNLKSATLLYHYMRVQPVLSPTASWQPAFNERSAYGKSGNRAPHQLQWPRQKGPKKRGHWEEKWKFFSHFHMTKCNCLPIIFFFPSHQSSFIAITLPFQYYSPIYALKIVYTDRTVKVKISLLQAMEAHRVARG
jgi:hypothetical protein